MDLENVVTAMLQQGLTAQEFHKFAVIFGITEDPFVVDVLHHLLVRETTPSTPRELTEEDVDDLLDMLKSPEPPFVMDEFQPWSLGLEAAALEFEEIVSASLVCVQDGKFR